MVRLKEETCQLREQIAVFEGRESVLQEVLRDTQGELVSIKENLQQLTVILTVAFYIYIVFF